MTDLQRFKDLYLSFGIKFTKEHIKDEKGLTTIKFEMGDFGIKVDGYYGFYTEVIFDSDGKFVSQGFYE